MDDTQREIIQRIQRLEEKRVHQSDIPNDTIKQRHVGEGVRFIRSGLDTDLPTSGEGTANNGTAMYFATDTHKLYIWDGSQWRYATLT